jgi:hypothetical protein
MRFRNAVAFVVAAFVANVTVVVAASPAAAGRGHGSAASQAGSAEGSSLPLPDQVLPAGSTLYLAPMPNGFETYVIAGLQQKKVPLRVVTIRERADFEMTGVSETDRAGWAKMLFLGNDSTSETASVKIVNLKTGDVVFAYSVKKGQSARGKQSAGESVAKHVKMKIENR